ncbi:MAG: hypothetical protein AAF479_15455 [Pseudomonadota bacterium]
MQLDTGDIIISRGWPGHAMLVYDDRQIIHGQGKTNGFHKSWLKGTNKAGVYWHIADGEHVYKFPWHAYNHVQQQEIKAKIKFYADAIEKTATYGMYRALRLQLGNSHFGKGAAERLQKYRARFGTPSSWDDIDRIIHVGNIDKGVKKITCVEAVAIALQLATPVGTPGFVALDGAHTMPSQLGTFLKSTWGGQHKMAVV